jgi:hypothetical protein
MTFCPPLEHSLDCTVDRNRLTLMRLSSPIASKQPESTSPGLPHLVRSTFRLSQPLSGFLLQLPRGLISYLIHFWGSPFRVFPPPAVPQPHQKQLPSYRFLPTAEASMDKRAGLTTLNSYHTARFQGFHPLASPFTSQPVLPD